MKLQGSSRIGVSKETADDTPRRQTRGVVKQTLQAEKPGQRGKGAKAKGHCFTSANSTWANLFFDLGVLFWGPTLGVCVCVFVCLCLCLCLCLCAVGLPLGPLLAWNHLPPDPSPPSPGTPSAVFPFRSKCRPFLLSLGSSRGIVVPVQGRGPLKLCVWASLGSFSEGPCGPKGRWGAN